MKLSSNVVGDSNDANNFPHKLLLINTQVSKLRKVNDIMKIIKSLQESSLLIKGVRKTIKNEAKEQKGGFLGMLLGTLSVNFLQNMLADKRVMSAGEGTIRASQNC